MFGISRRRMKLGRVKKVQLSDSTQGTISPMRQIKRASNQNNEGAVPAGDRPSENDSRSPSSTPEISSCTSGSSENWMVLPVTGEKPMPRFNHAATVIENKMIVVGGESGKGLLDDVQVLNFDRFSWTKASSKLYLFLGGKKVLLIGGKTEPGTDRLSVWVFDTETECWSLMEAKGDVPVSRSGHSVVRANSVLILFGGEDAKRRKLNDLHMFDLKSLTWLPLHCTGSGPSQRSNHVATLYEDKNLFIFGGSSKSRALNDLYSLDFETMIWSRIKIRGFHPSPRAGCCGVLCGTKWYIAGGGNRKKRHLETVIFDVLKEEWSVAVASPPSSIATNKGFSLVLVQHKEKDCLVAFGGTRKEPSNQVEVLVVEKNESPIDRRPVAKKAARPLFGRRSSSKGLATQLSNGSSQRSVDSVARQNLASTIEQHGSGRKSLSESILVDPNPSSGNVSLRKQFSNEEEYNRTQKVAKHLEDEGSSLQAAEHMKNHSDTVQTNSNGCKSIGEETALAFEDENLSPRINGNESLPVSKDDLVFMETNCKVGAPPSTSSIYQFYEKKIASLIRKNGILEGQLAAASTNQEATEKSFSSVLKSKQEMEKKLADTMKETELLKEKLADLELTHEEANSLSNIVHSDNVRLEHDVAFLKAVLDDTQKELHSTRGVLAGERARTFQLQVEVFHLKQRLQSMENRAPTPRKPFHV
ncbi:hypothetical protein NL676_020803 [Syzygium grande]|nr:hypothetical protein NL676_020803 [Syzygium grande]